MAAGADSSAPQKSAPATDGDEDVAAWLLAGFDSDRSTWEQHVGHELFSNRYVPLFFAPSLHVLDRRGKRLEQVTRKYEDLQKLNFEKRRFNTLVRGDAGTLDGVLYCYRVLRAIANCPHEDAREATFSGDAAGGPATCKELLENSIIPSHFWLDENELRSFRDQYGMNKKTFAELMFGPNRYAFFFAELRKLEKGRTEYDYRVTPFIKERVSYVVSALYEATKDRLENPQYDPPHADQLFFAQKNAGLGGHNRTRALAANRGNMMSPMTKADQDGIDKRVQEFAASTSGTFKRRDRNDGSTD
jgi:hypothetical protein